MIMKEAQINTSFKNGRHLGQVIPGEPSVELVVKHAEAEKQVQEEKVKQHGPGDAPRRGDEEVGGLVRRVEGAAWRGEHDLQPQPDKLDM